MEVIALTIFVSLLLALTFLVFFVSEFRQRSRFDSAERDSLLPLDDGNPTEGKQR